MIESGRYDEAVVCYDAILALGYNIPVSNIYFLKAFALYKSGKYDAMIVCCDEAIRVLEEEGPDAWHLDGFYLYKGYAFEAKGKEFYKEA